jgi:hypothetical protein
MAMSIPKMRGGGLSSDPEARYVACFEEAQKLLKEASDLWAMGNPEDPPTERVLDRLLEPFKREKFLRQPW